MPRHDSLSGAGGPRRSPHQDSFERAPQASEGVKAAVRAARDLKTAQGRREQGRFLIEGVRLLEDALSQDVPIARIFLTPHLLETTPRGQYLARLGVVLATGGFEWNAKMVRGFLGVPLLTPASPPTGLGLGLGLALEAGAAISNMTNAWWDVVMHEPGQIYDGQPYYQTTTLWRGRAGTMMVNRHGRRFVNESMNYSDMGVIMKAFDPLAYEHPNMPSYILFDGVLRENFRIGSLNPGTADPDWLIRSDSIDASRHKTPALTNAYE